MFCFIKRKFATMTAKFLNISKRQSLLGIKECHYPPSKNKYEIKSINRSDGVDNARLACLIFIRKEDFLESLDEILWIMEESCTPQEPGKIYIRQDMVFLEFLNFFSYSGCR